MRNALVWAVAGTFVLVPAMFHTAVTASPAPGSPMVVTGMVLLFAAAAGWPERPLSEVVRGESDG